MQLRNIVHTMNLNRYCRDFNLGLLAHIPLPKEHIIVCNPQVVITPK